jgi:hypothetical protein
MILAPTLLLNAGSGAAIVRPTFSRDFAGERTLNNGTGPAIAFTRASDATFFDANGALQTATSDTPRFDHDPATGASRGLLIEESRTNLFPWSEDFSDVSWSKANASVVTNDAIAPDGTQTANKLQSTINGSAVEIKSSVVVNSTTATCSVFLKKGSGATVANRVQLRNETTPTSLVTIDVNLDTGNISYVTGSSGASAVNVGNGWWRISLTATSGITSGNTISMSVLDNFIKTMTDADFVYAWGAQLEAGAFATSYIPTTGATATRAADSAVVTPISSFYNQSEGTLFAEATPKTESLDNGLQRALLTANDNTDLNQITIGQGGSGSLDKLVFVSFIGGGGGTAEMLGGSGIAGSTQKAAGAYKTSDFAFSVNGGTADTEASGSPASGLTHLFIGRRPSDGFISGHIRKIAYWPRRLTNTLLEEITT